MKFVPDIDSNGYKFERKSAFYNPKQDFLGSCERIHPAVTPLKGALGQTSMLGIFSNLTTEESRDE
ncbi:MAG: hypothetical protein F4X44_10815 [Gammaproteobacteria bacterium]|nr:hypothetical protein [Gammaproteobacteria bacterium]MYD81089.1 hypothetical protein [Gammaproteobacteria bacterium]